MIEYYPIAGTWNSRDPFDATNWIHPKSPFSEEMRREGLEPCDPLKWSTDLDGILGRDSTWEDAALALGRALRAVSFEHRNVIAHSHGGTVAIYALRYVDIARLVTISTPVRKGTLARLNEALERDALEGLWHLHELSTNPFADPKQWLGSWFDGQLALERRFLVKPHNADRVQNIGANGVNHSYVLNKPNVFQLMFVDGGVTAFLRGDPAIAPTEIKGDLRAME